MMDKQVEKLMAAVLDSPKYRDVHAGLVARIGQDELGKGRSLKEAIKASKNKLHQVGGAYQTASLPYDKWLLRLRECREDEETFDALLLEILQGHASTKERLPILNSFFSTIFASLPPFTSVLDVACGLNPLMIPWMNLGANTRYFACDIYGEMISFVQGVMDLLPVDGVAETCDVIASAPSQEVDLALVLKTIPCLEQVDTEAGDKLLDGLNAKHILISFPAKSLGGREKGMVETYEARFEALSLGKGWEVERFEFETELAFLVHK